MKKRFPTLGHFLIILLFFILFSLPFGLMQTLLPAQYKSWLILVGYVIPMILTIWATRVAFDRKGKLNYRTGHWTLFPVIVLVSYAFLVVGEFSIFLLPEPAGFWKKLFDMMNQSLEEIFNNKILGFLMVAVAAPVLEETLFRGVLLRALLKKFNPWTAILLSAVAFGIFHMNPWQFLYATVLGIWLGYIYWKTRSLFYPIIIHMVLNGTAFFAAQMVDTAATEGLVEQLTGKDLTRFLIAVGWSAVLIMIAYFYLEKYFKNIPEQIVLATQNKHKIQELQKILPANYQLVSLQDIGYQGQLKETGDSLDANARQKMRQIAVPYDVDALADDTGLEVEALGGAPGVYSARYAGENASYDDNVQKLLTEMKGEENRKARFRTVMAYSKGPKEFLVEGEIKGHIATEPRGSNGFGYDSVFIPEGYDKTFAEMTDEEKNRISHRGRALQKLKAIL